MAAKIESYNRSYHSEPPPHFEGYARGRYSRYTMKALQPRSGTNYKSNLPWPKNYHCEPPAGSGAGRSRVVPNTPLKPPHPTRVVPSTPLKPPHPTRVFANTPSKPPPHPTPNNTKMTGKTPTKTPVCSTRRPVFSALSSSSICSPSTSDDSSDSADMTSSNTGNRSIIFGREMAEMRALCKSTTSTENGATDRKAYQVYKKWIEEEKVCLDKEICELREANYRAMEIMAAQKEEIEKLKAILDQKDSEYNKRWALHEVSLKAETERCRKYGADVAAKNDKLIWTGQTMIGLACLVGGFVTFAHFHHLFL